MGFTVIALAPSRSANRSILSAVIWFAGFAEDALYRRTQAFRRGQMTSQCVNFAAEGAD
jgi:hypothetical protein